MKKTFLFDLDGTLLPLNMDDFIHHYTKDIIKAIHEFEIDSKEALNAFMTSTMAMVNNDGTQTNEQAFWNSFNSLIKHPGDPLIKRLELFYENEFQNYQKFTTPVTGLNEILRQLKESGHQLLVATNPLFPKIASVSRVDWAGLDHDLFDEISTYENYHYCKPNVNYYVEISEKFKVDPNNSVMIGNDAQEDLVSQQLGFETFLVTDHLIDRSNGQYQTDHEGNYRDLMNFLKQYINI